MVRRRDYFAFGVILVTILAGVFALNTEKIGFGEPQLGPYTDLVSYALQECEARHSVAYKGVYTCEDMKNIERNLKGNYRLMNDLNCNFEPIAFGNGDFRGVFDGQKYTITYRFDSDTHGKIGLFSDVGNCGIIKSLHVDADIHGTSSVGGVAGYVYKGVLKEVYSTGSVKADTQDAGGLVGGLKSGIIVDSYSEATVFGQERVGGIVGAAWNFPNNEQRPIVKDSYANGLVLSEGANVGGLIGLCDYPAISSYWNLDRYSEDNGCGTGKTDEEMKIQGTFIGWDFDETWVMRYYPRLRYAPDVHGSKYLKARITRDYVINIVSILDIPSGHEICSNKREGDFCFIDDKRIKIVDINYRTIGLNRNATFEIDERFDRLYEYDSGNYMILPDYDGFPRESQTFNVYDNEGGIMETWTWRWSDGQPWLQGHEYYYGNHSFSVRRSPRDAFLLDIKVTLENGRTEIYAIYGNGLHFTGTGRGEDSRLAVSGKKTLTYVERDESGSSVDEAFVLP